MRMTSRYKGHLNPKDTSLCQRRRLSANNTSKCLLGQPRNIVRQNLKSPKPLIQLASILNRILLDWRANSTSPTIAFDGAISADLLRVALASQPVKSSPNRKRVRYSIGSLNLTTIASNESQIKILERDHIGDYPPPTVGSKWCQRFVKRYSQQFKGEVDF